MSPARLVSEKITSPTKILRASALRARRLVLNDSLDRRYFCTRIWGGIRRLR